jgi:hypothetical protein
MFQEACAPSPNGDANAARTYFCPAGQGRLQVNAATEYTTPESAQVGFRTGKASCAASEFCSNGKRERKVNWGTGVWATCAPTSGASATFVFNERNGGLLYTDANGDGVFEGFTTVDITTSTPTGQSMAFSIDGGDSRCLNAWTNTAGSYNGANTGQFEISGTTLQLKNSVRTATPPGLSFAVCPPPDGYSINVRVAVGSYSETCQVTIKVGDVNDKPAIPLGQTFSVPENTGEITTCTGGVVQASDDEVDNGIQALTWAIAGGCTDLSGTDLGNFFSFFSPQLVFFFNTCYFFLILVYSFKVTLVPSSSEFAMGNCV